MENKDFTVSVHIEGVSEETASDLFAKFLELADQMGVGQHMTGAVYETPSDEEQIETIKKQAEMIDDDGDEDNA